MATKEEILEQIYELKHLVEEYEKDEAPNYLNELNRYKEIADRWWKYSYRLERELEQLKAQPKVTINRMTPPPLNLEETP